MSYELWGVSSYRDYYFQGLALFRENNEGLMLKISALESLCIGQFTLSTQLMKPNYLVILAPLFHLGIQVYFRGIWSNVEISPYLYEETTIG
mgnify:CR=1 FL=1